MQCEILDKILDRNTEKNNGRQLVKLEKAFS